MEENTTERIVVFAKIATEPLCGQLLKNLKRYLKLNLNNNRIKKFSNEININRLKNNPVSFSKKEIISIYKEI